MEKKLTPRRTSSPVRPETSPAVTKNDSFLEDMDLFSHNRNIYISEREDDRFITKRTSSPCTVPFATVIEDGFGQRSSKVSNPVKAPVTSVTKTLKTVRKSGRQEIGSGDGLQQENSQVGTTTRESKVLQENKLKSKDNRVRLRRSEPKAPECQNRTQNELSKSQQDRKSLVKERSRRSGSCKETDCSSNTSEEQRQPSNLSRQSNSQLETSKDHHRRSDGAQKLDGRDIPESVALLSAIKEIISTYTKEEGNKINRVLNELHILSQASLIKNLMFQTDEIRKDLQLGGNMGQLRTLMNENEILKENFALLKLKYEDVQRRLEETERIKEENAALKLKLQELLNRKSS
ncbi:uncharacterized protein [Neodiprion pinetum]|uniref:Uncharacterized protein LOC107217706 n=1 Tax=Neodiprion lecontei TaxID=441921 RepID=A0A6J0B727_NEOLC|nr:uncharacterized protein LOC107217706 [Neodiprion lecontei]XP_046469456.1 uncharacterized protein LOC124212893 [Neodiprion pinetum]